MKCFRDYKKLGNYTPGKHLLSSWLLSVWVHFVFILSVTDLNRHDVPKTPVRGQPPSVVERKPNVDDNPIRRIVVIHVDGLTPLKTFGQIEDHSKLKYVMGNKGSWGVVFSPIYVSPQQRMMSTLTGSYWGNGTGFLQDASSVYFIGDEATAERLSPLGKKFHAFTWSEKTWDEYTYKSNDEEADLWVKQQAASLLRSQTFPEMHRDKVVVFVRIIGVGMSAKLEGENSFRVKEALSRVFNVIDTILTSCESLWGDQQTSYLIISDTKISPVIAWGPLISSALVPDPNPTGDWKMPYTKRRDLERRSLAPLLACLLGVVPPLESVATLPLDFLKERSRLRAKCAAITAKQVTALFQETVRMNEEGSVLKIVSYWSPLDRETAKRMVERIDIAFTEGDYSGVVSASRVLIDKCQHGLHYYGEFKRKFCCNLLLLIVLGWILCCSTWMCPRLDVSFPENIGEDERKNSWYCNPKSLFDLFMALISISVLLVALLDNMPFRFIAYMVTAPVTWWLGLRDTNIWIKVYRCTTHADSMSFSSTVYIAFAAISWLMVNDKLAMSLLLVGSLTFSSFFSMTKTKSTRLKLWLLTSIPFTVALHHRTSDTAEALEAGHLISVAAWIAAVCAASKVASARLGDSPILVANLLSLVAITLKEASGSKNTFQHATWIVTGFLPIIGSQNVIMRLIQIFFSLAVPFFVLSTGIEPLSLLGLLFHITAWYVAEGFANNENYEVLQAELDEGEGRTRKFGAEDARRVFFFVIYVCLSMSTVGVTDKFIVYKARFPSEVNARIVNAAAFWGLKGAVPLLCISCIVVLLWKRCKGDELALALAIMFMFSLMTLMYLMMVFAAGGDVDRLYWAVSHFFVGQYLSIIALLTLPAAYFLTIPSLFSKFLSHPYVSRTIT